MRHSLYWPAAVLVAGGAIGLAGRPALAAGAEPAAADPAAAQAALTASEDVTLLKVITSLGLTRAQLTTLLPVVESAQTKLAEQDAKEAAKLTAWKGSLDQARRDLLAGTGSGSRATEQFGLAQWTAAQNRARLTADLVSSLRATLEKTLTPEQTTQMAANGQAALMAQRMAGWQGGGGWGGRGGFGGPPGGPRGGGPGGGGPGGGGPSGRLDQIRQMSPAEFQDFSQRQAGRMGGPDSPRFQQYVSSMNQMRDMPQGQYLLQRDQLAAQQFGRRGFGPGGATDDEAIRAFVEQYLLSPRAPIVLRDRLQAQ
jgi:hypothetical protein